MAPCIMAMATILVSFMAITSTFSTAYGESKDITSKDIELIELKDITLEDALAAFYKNNYDILISRYEVDKSYADYIGSKMLPNPSLSFNYIGFDAHNIGRLSPGDNTQLTVRLDQLIELGGKRGLRTQAASEALEAAKLTQKDTVRTLLAGFYAFFFNVNLDRLNLEYAKKELDNYDKILEVAKKRHNAGFLSLIDYTKLTLARVDLANAITTSDNQLKNDVAQFNFLTGSSIGVVPAIRQVTDTFKELNEDDLLNTAYLNRYDLLSLLKQMKASESNTALSKANKIPDLTVGGEYDSFGSQGRPTIGLGFSINIPVFNRNQAEILHREAEQSQLSIQVDRAKKQIALDVRQAVNNYRSSVEVFRNFQQNYDGIMELSARSEQAFSMGGITVLDLLDTRKAARDFMNKYNQALVQCNLNRELINVYTGDLKSGDLKPGGLK